MKAAPKLNSPVFASATPAVVAGAVLAPLALHEALHMHGLAALGRTALMATAAVSHAALYLGLAVLFGGSLLPGREALVSRLARHVEPCLTRDLLSYTRGVTRLWTGFAVCQLSASALLLLCAPLPVWSLFVNVLDAPLVVLTFAAEYAVRRWRFRRARLASLADTIRIFQQRAKAT